MIDGPSILLPSVVVGAFVVELVASRLVLRDDHHDVKDGCTNVAIGGGYLLASALWGLGTAAVFATAWALTPWRIDLSSGWAWLALFLAEDLLYYVSHRASHELAVLWAAHTVHHSSARLNLSTGLRNSWTGGAIDWCFFLPLVVVGFDPVSIVAVQIAATAWNFLCHTAYGPRLPGLDAIFNTPSNHRVHHSNQPDHAHRNYGGVLVVWDRLFGTYQREPATPLAYGVVPMPTRPHDPVHLQLAPWAALIRRRLTGS